MLFVKKMGVDTQDLKLYCTSIVENYSDNLLESSRADVPLIAKDFCVNIVRTCGAEKLPKRIKKKPARKEHISEKAKLQQRLDNARKSLDILVTSKAEKVVVLFCRV
jgi:hypothetical protein